MSEETTLPIERAAGDQAAGEARRSADAEVQRHLIRNSLAVAGNYVAIGPATAFVNTTSVIPSFVSQLTTSAPLLGMVATIDSGMWLAPQLLAASYVADKPRKKLYTLVPAMVSRLMYLAVLPATLLLIGGVHPSLALLAFFLCFITFTVGDSLCVVPWFDLLAKVIPPTRRGRLIGVSQTVTWALAIACGPVVGWILGHPQLAFPRNYALLFVLSGAAWMISWLSILSIKEPLQPDLRPRQSFLDFVRALGPILREDGAFRCLVATRLLVGAGMMVYPFYVLYAREVYSLEAEWVGFFVSAQMAGSMLGAIGLGAVADRRGTTAVVRMAAGLASLAPGLALVSSLWIKGGSESTVPLFALIFAAMGVLQPAFNLGFVNYLLEAAPSHARPTYVGLFNTIGGLILFVPPLLGLLLQATSFTVIFAVATSCFLLALLLALGIREPRRRTAG